MCFQLRSNRASYRFLTDFSVESLAFIYLLQSDKIHSLRIPILIGFAFRGRTVSPRRESNQDLLCLLSLLLRPLAPMEPAD